MEVILKLVSQWFWAGFCWVTSCNQLTLAVTRWRWFRPEGKVLRLAPPPPEPLQLAPLFLLVLVFLVFVLDESSTTVTRWHYLWPGNTGLLVLLDEAAEGGRWPEGAEVEHGPCLAVERRGLRRKIVGTVAAVAVVFEAVKPGNRIWVSWANWINLVNENDSYLYGRWINLTTENLG